MSFHAPRRVCFDGNDGNDGNEGMMRPGLHPPWPTVRINNNPLLWSSVSYLPRDRVDSFSSTLRRGRNGGELDGWAGGAFLRMASLRCEVKGHNKDERRRTRLENEVRRRSRRELNHYLNVCCPPSKKNVLVPRFFLPFSCLDVPYISREIEAEIPIPAWPRKKVQSSFLLFFVSMFLNN
jgi:hypothetical protein